MRRFVEFCYHFLPGQMSWKGEFAWGLRAVVGTCLSGEFLIPCGPTEDLRFLVSGRGEIEIPCQGKVLRNE